MATYLRHRNLNINHFLMKSISKCIFVMDNSGTTWIEMKKQDYFFTKDFENENYILCEKEDFNKAFVSAMSNILNSKL